MPTDLRSELGNLPTVIRPAPWAGHEYVRGYGVFALPTADGHVLALRVFPENDFAPYVTVWHRTPDGRWTIYYHAPRPDVACPRYYGAAAQAEVEAHIDLSWIGPRQLQITMEEPEFRWVVSMEEDRLLTIMNRVSVKLPFWTWKSSRLLKFREWIARRLLKMGSEVRLSGVMPSGHFGILMPIRIFLIADSRAILNGMDLGAPAITENPRIGELPLPGRPTFAIGQAFWEIKDRQEYDRTRREVAAASR